MRLSEIQTEVSRIAAARDSALTELAHEVRTELVVPACEKYGLRFVSEMGCYFFGWPGLDHDTFQTAEAAAQRGCDMEDVFEALDIDVGDTLCLGHWVDSYPPGE